MATERDSGAYRDEKAAYPPSDPGLLKLSEHTALLVIDRSTTSSRKAGEARDMNKGRVQMNNVAQAVAPLRVVRPFRYDG
jgi:hypothetical protein